MTAPKTCLRNAKTRPPRLPRGKWWAFCGCGWRTETKSQADALMVAEAHNTGRAA